MIDSSAILLAVRFVFLVVCTFLAILVWARRRDPAWMFLSIGVIAAYGDILYSLLKLFGLASHLNFRIAGIDILDFVFPVLPWLFFSIAFIIFLNKRN